MHQQMERFWYPFTATTVIARRMVPLLLFTLGIGLFLWAGHEYYLWLRPWAVWPGAALGVGAWLAAGYFFTLLPEVRADKVGLTVRRWGLFWRRFPWEVVAGVEKTAEVDLLGWTESLYSVYRRQTGRRGQVRAFRFSGHIRNSERLVALIREQAASPPSEQGAKAV
jgi:hypothetical protein